MERPAGSRSAGRYTCNCQRTLSNFTSKHLNSMDVHWLRITRRISRGGDGCRGELARARETIQGLGDGGRKARG